MTLSSNETEFVKCVVLHGNKLWAARSAYPRLEKGFEQAAIKHMMQNPGVVAHIDAGVLYMFRQIVKHTEVPVPAQLTVQDKMNLLKLIINGERQSPSYIVTSEGLKMIFVEPAEDEVADAKRMLSELQRAENEKWMK